MSQRETHPIDDLFRQALSGAEATPPPQVWEGVRQGRRSGGWLAWFRMNSLLLLLIPAGASVAWLAWPAGVENNEVAAIETMPARDTMQRPAASHSSPTTTGIDHAVHSTDLDDAAMDRDQRYERTSPQHATEEPLRGSTATEDPARATFKPLDPPALHASTYTNDGITPRPVPPVEMPATFRTSVSAGALDLVGQGAQTLRPLLYRTRPESGTLLSTPQAPRYVLPRAEWLLSIAAGWYDVKYSWHGADEQLARALQRTEARTSTFAPGLMVERRWRSGWGIGAGVFHERSEQQYSYVDQRTQVTQEVITWMVTLDSEVFISDQDTISSYTTIEKTFAGLNRRSITRIPVEGHYHRSAGRFHWGVRAGVALEKVSARQEYSLVVDQQEDRLMVAGLSNDHLRRRHPMMLLATAGAEVGFTLHEHWSLWLNPMYMTGALPLSRQADAWTSPSRFGLQVRLSHHLQPCGKK